MWGEGGTNGVRKPWSKRMSAKRGAESQEVISDIGGGSGDTVMGTGAGWPDRERV